MMRTSLKLKYMGKNTSDLITPIAANQKILRYMKHLVGDPLDAGLPDIEENVIETNSLLLVPFDPNPMTGEEIKLVFNPVKGSFADGQAVGIDTYLLDIIVPLNYWILNGESFYRPFCIAHEIAKELDGRSIAGIGSVCIREWKISRTDNGYGVLSLSIEVKNTSIKGSW